MLLLTHAVFLNYLFISDKKKKNVFKRHFIDPNSWFWKKKVKIINEVSACTTNPVYFNIKLFFDHSTLL